MKLAFEPHILENIERHLEKSYPNEGCGFVFGEDGGTRSITAYTAVPNVQEGNKKRRFEISPLDYLKAENYATEHDLKLLGVYHSHPDHPAQPSEKDLEQAVDFFSYLIVSVRKGKAKLATSWRLNERGRFDEELILQPEIEDDSALFNYSLT